MKEKNSENQINQNDLREFRKELKRKSKNELIYIVTSMVVEKLLGRPQQEQGQEDK